MKNLVGDPMTSPLPPAYFFICLFFDNEAEKVLISHFRVPVHASAFVAPFSFSDVAVEIFLFFLKFAS